MKKKIIFSICFLVLLIAAFAACSTVSDDTSDTSIGESGDASSETVSVSVLDTGDNEVYDATAFYNGYDSVNAKVLETEKKKCDEWFENNVLCVKDGKVPAFSFNYNGKSLAESMNDWTVDVSEEKGAGHICYSIALRHKTDDITVTCEAVKYTDFPSVEWTVYASNTGDAETKVIDSLKCIDSEVATNGQAVLRYNSGSTDTIDAFLPAEQKLINGRKYVYSGRTGRPSYSYLPFFNVTDDNGGTVICLGWPGQWSAAFSGTENGFSVSAGQETIKGKLLKGETIRSPLVYVEFYEGSYVKGTNLFREWSVNHLYTNNQKEIFATASIFSGTITEDRMLKVINNAAKQFKFGAEYFWGQEFWFEIINGSWIQSTGTWDADAERYPNGLGAVGQAAKDNDMGFISWFEVERVMPETYLYTTYPQYCLAPGPNNNDSNYGASWRLWDFSDDDATRIMCEYIDKRIKDYKITVYRQDFNLDPLNFWTNKDTKEGLGRKGFTENKYVVNFLNYWDYLLENNPGLIIDNCASGGRRICLETLKRSEVLWRNDLCHDPSVNQNHGFGLSQWVVYNGAGQKASELMSEGEYKTPGNKNSPTKYLIRSNFGANYDFIFNYNVSNTLTLIYRGEFKKYLDIREYYLEDIYPLTNLTSPDSANDGFYVAQQYNRAEDGTGLITVAKRRDCECNYIRLRLCGLESDAYYRFTDLDGDYDNIVVSGGDAMNGIVIGLPDIPGVALWTYEKIS